CASADGQFVALAQAAENIRQARDALAEAAEALAVALDPALAEARRAVEVERFLRRLAARIEHEVAAHQKVRPRHRKLDAPFAREPAGEDYMLGMEQRHDEARHRLAAKAGLENLAPERLHLVGGNAGIDHRPAVAVFQQPEIDVVELE